MRRRTPSGLINLYIQAVILESAGERDRMVKIKPLEQSAGKWSTRASAASGDYLSGVEAATWKSHVTSEQAKKNYAAALANAPAKWTRKVGAVSDEDWKAGVRSVGQSRFAQGVSAKSDRWAKGFAPYHAVIAGTDLGPRGARGDPANYERSKKLGTALHDKAVKG
jgi:hypothetical protein